MAALTAALAALTAAQTVSQFSGQRKAAKAARQQGDYEASVYSQNADIAEQQAADAIARGREAELRQRTGTKVLVGSQRANLAAQGIDPNVGSSAEIQTETQRLSALDEQTIRNNAAREAWGYRTEAGQLRSQGAFARAAGQNAAADYTNQSWSTLLTGASQFASLFPDTQRIPKTPKTKPLTIAPNIYTRDPTGRY